MIKQVLRYFKTRYMNSRVILLIDVFLSSLAIFMAYLAMLWSFDEFGDYSYRMFFLIFLIGVLIWICCSFVLKTHHHIIRYFTFGNIWRIFFSIMLQSVVMGCLMCVVTDPFSIQNIITFLLFYLAFSSVLIIGCRLVMILLYSRLSVGEHHYDLENYLVYGTDSSSVSLDMRLAGSHHIKVVGFVSNNKSNRELTLVAKPVLHFEDYFHFNKYVAIHNVKGVIFLNQESLKKEAKNIFLYANKLGLKSLIAPIIKEGESSHISHNEIRNVKIEDLLGRDEIKVDLNRIIANFNNKVIMVTGAAGSIGSELVRQLATFGVKQLVLFDNAETPMHNLCLELNKKFSDLSYAAVIGDVRSEKRMEQIFKKYRPQVVFHAAAYKHVPLMEENPCEAVTANVKGTRQLALLCVKYEVERMVMISTDKAVNPSNIMGATKRLAEIFVQSLGSAIEKNLIKSKTRFVTTRFGNVLGSNGSVIPLFRQQIAEGGPVTVTHPDIVRFFMTIPEACRLVMEAATMCEGNDIFVFDMGESVKIVDLARHMIELAGYVPDQDIKIKFTGLRPGEKLYEEVLSNKENTLPTSHKKIFHARVRTYENADIKGDYKKLEDFAADMNVEETVKMMKRIVPEFKSRNSIFEKFDVK